MVQTKNQTIESPFFARFLEGQEPARVKTELKAGGPPVHTLKYPSDDDAFEW